MLAYNEIFTLYSDKLHHYLAGIVGFDDAEDVLQEVFIKISNNLDSLKDENKLSFWIYRIALNAARDHLRTRKSKFGATSFEDLPGTGDSGCQLNLIQLSDKRTKTPDEKLIKDEMVQCYIEYVEKLPKKYYEVYVLSEFESLTNQEIADKLSLSIDTVKIRLHRARTELHDQLRKQCSCYSTKDGEIMCEPKE